MPRFTIEHLAKDRLAEAWPIMRASAHQPQLEWWLNDAARLIDHGGGVLVARALDGTVHGVATYRLAARLHVGRVLSVETLITFELNRHMPVRRALCDALDTLSLDFECRGIGIATG